MTGMIGIIGGAGPFAGLDLQRKILEETAASVDQDHVPVLALSQPGNILDRTEFLLGTVVENPGLAIAAQARVLAAAGATAVAIPCNTAHAPPIFEVIEQELARTETAVNFLHLVRETAVFIQQRFPAVQRVGVLSTTGTWQVGVYPQTLAEVGVTAVVPDEVTQSTLVHPAIYHPEYGIKATGTPTTRATANLHQAADLLRQHGAEAIILGCTEIPLAIPEASLYELPIIDPTRVLARALIRETFPHKLRGVGN